ncbi:hypothetical protein KUV57_11215 [Epibacterium sp. DP7N7-1]|nr:hypothetical protein [Epibacterium sp. DP7N7-1]
MDHKMEEIKVPKDLEGRIKVLRSFGWVVGDRDPKMNSNFDGSYMVVEDEYSPDYPGQTDGSDGDGIWCLVGNDLSELVDEALSHVSTLEYGYRLEFEGAEPSAGSPEM